MKIIVEGMMCNGCANRVKTALTNLGARNIEVDLNSKCVTFEGKIDLIQVKNSIESLGFDYSGEAN